jgi:terpene synthase-like protein
MVIEWARRQGFLDRATVVADDCEAWLTRYPIVRRASVTSACALVSTAAAPDLGTPELTLLTQWWLWIFGIDDRFDDPGYPLDTIDRWSAAFLDALHRDRFDDPSEALLAAFGSVRAGLGRYPLYPTLHDAWRRAMADVVTGMRIERGWLEAGSLPDYDTYLANGMVTIAMRPYTLVACALMDHVPALADLSALDPVIAAAARCFRLANDLRSDGRERAEGKVNAVILLEHALRQHGLGPDAARRRARAELTARCGADLAYLRRTRDTTTPSIRALARFLCAHTEFVWQMYQTGDYDTITAMLAGASGAAGSELSMD